MKITSMFMITFVTLSSAFATTPFESLKQTLKSKINSSNNQSLEIGKCTVQLKEIQNSTALQLIISKQIGSQGSQVRTITITDDDNSQMISSDNNKIQKFEVSHEIKENSGVVSGVISDIKNIFKDPKFERLDLTFNSSVKDDNSCSIQIKVNKTEEFKSSPDGIECNQ